jgi:hypothetical protein
MRREIVIRSMPCLKDKGAKVRRSAWGVTLRSGQHPGGHIRTFHPELAPRLSQRYKPSHPVDK